jgi:BirA family biotin operon repressor/biotin-[acetyl-CoA-carboxylase] ligase
MKAPGIFDDSSSTFDPGRMDTPYDAISLEVVGSTQDEARRRHVEGPLLVTARRQTAGRGRRGTAWIGADRAVAASLAFRCDWPVDTRPLLTLVAALAARDAGGRGIGLGWPNDLVVAGRKVGGLIAEAFGDVVVVGLGLNLVWADPVPGAGALYADDPEPATAGDLANAWARGVLRRVAAGPLRWGRDEYRAASVTLGRDVVWEPDGRGRAVDVTAAGGLVVETRSGVIVLDSGRVWHVGAPGPERDEPPLSPAPGRESPDDGAGG